MRTIRENEPCPRSYLESAIIAVTIGEQQREFFSSPFTREGREGLLPCEIENGTCGICQWEQTTNVAIEEDLSFK